MDTQEKLVKKLKKLEEIWWIIKFFQMKFQNVKVMQLTKNKLYTVLSALLNLFLGFLSHIVSPINESNFAPFILINNLVDKFSIII